MRGHSGKRLRLRWQPIGRHRGVGGDCTEDVNENNICDTDEQGCTDPTNPNYGPNAAFDDGSCFVAVAPSLRATTTLTRITKSRFATSRCTGCTNPEACNYDPEARWTMACATCLTSRTIVTATVNDADGDGVR